MNRGGPLRTKIILRDKLMEKLREALVAVLPIIVIVLIAGSRHDVFHTGRGAFHDSHGRKGRHLHDKK